MDGVVQLALLLSALGTAPVDGAASIDNVRASSGLNSAIMRVAPAILPPGNASPADPWLSEDKFRHAAASWAAMVFTYAAVRSTTDDSDVALGVALPVTAALGVAKELVDRRHGGPFSFRDLAADALGAGAAWLFLREVR